MFSVPQQLFVVVKCDDGLLKFVPLDEVFYILATLFKCNFKDIRIHGYIRRHIKQPGLKDKVFLIPRIIIRGKTHVLLPNFILPFCRYSAKALLIAFEDLIPVNTAKEISKKDWDRLSNLSEFPSSKKSMKYLKSRKDRLLARFHQLISLLIKRYGGTILPPFRCHPGLVKFFIFNAMHNAINVCCYFDHTVSLLNTV